MSFNIETIGKVLGILLLMGCISFWFGYLLPMLWGDDLLNVRETFLGLFAFGSALVTAKLILKSWLYLFLTLPVSAIAVLYGALSFILLYKK